jgi:hypothetical protein
MATQALNQFEIESPNDLLLGDPASVLYGARAPALAGAAECVSMHSAAGGNCMRGVLVALALEAGAALGAFGIWQLWHLLR